MLALVALAVTGVAGSAEAKGGGSNGAGAAAKMSRGAQMRVNRMKQKMALRTRGTQQQKSRRQLRLGKRKMMRAMSRREVGLHGSEAARARSAFARDIDTGHRHDANTHDEAAPETFSDHTAERREEASGAKQGKKMRDRARRRAESEHRKRRR